LSAMRNKLKENANWFSINVQLKTYVRIRINDDVMKHLISRFFKDSIKSYIISKKIFDDLYQIFNDSNVAQMLWRRINVSNKSNRLKISISSELNFSDLSAIQNFIIKTLCSRISRIRCRTSCKKFSLSSHTKSSICMNSSKCADILIRRWETWTINQDVKNFSMMQHETKKSLSSLIRIKIIKSIKTLINRSHVHDLKSLNRVLVRLLNYQKIKWTVSTVTIMKNQNTFLAIVVNLKRWILITSYVKWTCMIRMIHRMIISRSSRKKNNLCYSRCRDKWNENSENWCLQFREHSFRW
jgi:hypothetical protein